MKEPLIYDKYYHIYNRGIDGCNIFEDHTDYEYFLILYSKYIESVADTFAWCLLKNHFHILVRIKEEKEIGKYKFTPKSFKEAQQSFKYYQNENFDDVKWETTSSQTILNQEQNKAPIPINHFKHLFNSYAKYFNSKYKRHGSLLERSFHRKKVNHEKYFKHLVIYVHNNPVKHGFVGHPIEWGWSSYLDFFSNEVPFSKKEITLSYFDNLENFKSVHEKTTDFTNIDNMLGVE